MGWSCGRCGGDRTEDHKACDIADEAEALKDSVEAQSAKVDKLVDLIERVAPALERLAEASVKQAEASETFVLIEEPHTGGENCPTCRGRCSLIFMTYGELKDPKRKRSATTFEPPPPASKPTGSHPDARGMATVDDPDCERCGGKGALDSLGPQPRPPCPACGGTGRP